MPDINGPIDDMNPQGGSPLDRIRSAGFQAQVHPPGLEEEAAPRPHFAFQTFNPKTDASFGDYLEDFALAPIRGVHNAGRDFYSLVDHIGNGWLPKWDRWEANTTAGQIATDFSQMIAGFGVGSLALRGIGLAGKLSKMGLLGRFGEDAIKGTIGNVLTFENHHNLSNLLKDHDIGGPITDFLAIGEDDPEVVARLKSSLEAIGLTPIVAPIFAALGHGFGAAAKKLGWREA